MFSLSSSLCLAIYGLASCVLPRFPLSSLQIGSGTLVPIGLAPAELPRSRAQPHDRCLPNCFCCVASHHRFPVSPSPSFSSSFFFLSSPTYTMNPPSNPLNPPRRTSQGSAGGPVVPGESRIFAMSAPWLLSCAVNHGRSLACPLLAELCALNFVANICLIFRGQD